MEYILRIICAAIPFVLLLTVRHIRSAAIYAMLLGLSVFCEGSVIPNISGAPNLILMIICGIISRFVPGYMMGWYTVRSTSVSEFITAMDKMHMLKQLDLAEYADTHPMALSGGQKQRTAIASGIASSKPVIIFDEPTSGLDLAHMKQVSDELKKLKDMGKTVIVVTHDPKD